MTCSQFFPLNFDLIAADIVAADFTGQNFGFGALPEEVGLMKNLKSLTLANCSVAMFSSNICNLTKLHEFKISQHEQRKKVIYALEKVEFCVHDAPNIVVYNVSHTEQFIDE